MNESEKSSSSKGMSTSIQIPTLRIYEDFDKIIAKEVYFTDSGEKIIVSFLNFSNICPEEQHRLLMSDDSGEEQYQSDEHQTPTDVGTSPGKPRKKSSSSKRTLDQRKASLNKLHYQHQTSHSTESNPDEPSPADPTIAGHKPTCSPTTKPHHHNHNHHNHYHHRSHGHHRSSSKSNQSGYEKYQMSLLEVPMPRDYCDPSSDDLSTDWDSDAAAVDSNKTDNNAAKEVKPSNWRKLRNIVQWTPFIQTYKNKQRFPWVQLGGHQGNFKAGFDPGTVLKKYCTNEEHCFKFLMKDLMRPYVPEFKGIVDGDDETQYLQLQDLLQDFYKPCVMDCKIGVRTYLEEELLKAKEKQKLRKDMYEKMIQVDSNAPTEEEHKAKGVTKPRYMVWRETISSTATLGFRIEGIKKDDGTSSKDFKTVKAKEEILSKFEKFTEGCIHALPKYIQRLKSIRATLECSEFFRKHEIIGCSLLFVHDRDKAGIWLIDFAKTIPLPEDVQITHSKQWQLGNHEDGFLVGLNNLIELFSEVYRRREDKSTKNS